MDACCDLGILKDFATFIRKARVDMDGKTRNGTVSTTSEPELT